ncbi:MAG TPA: transglutaminase-like domain-containing protein [Spirochaetia bacterium]|nr:transglutaminase-like domain-containing protein [Spirochaetia bacterium]
MASRSGVNSTSADIPATGIGRFARIMAYAAVPAVAVATRYALRADMSIFSLLVLSAFLVVPAVRRRTTPSRGWTGVHAVVFAAAGAGVLGAILITPFRSFQEWFTLFGSGLNSETSAVSNLFLVVTIVFAAMLLPAAFSVGVLWAGGAMLLVLLFLAAVITQNIALCAAFVIAALGLLALWTRSRSLVGGGAVAAALAVLFSAMPADGSRNYVDYTLSPALRRIVVSFDPQFPLLYDISRAAESFHEKKLGGAPVLTNKPIFEITGAPGQTVYVRTDVLDQYTGQTWKISERVLRTGTRYRRSANGWRDTAQRLKVKVLAGNIDLVPTTLDTVGILTGSLARDVVEGNYDTGFRLSEPLARNQVVTLLRSDGLTPFLRQDLRQAYLQVPAELPTRVRDLAYSLGQNGASSEEVLKRIQTYLARNYIYTLASTAPNGKNSDFVDTFLFNSSGGYCVNFASSFVILARLDGIPARYATGYLGHIPADSDHATITDLASHSWPEVWFPDRGWVTYEATPAVDPASYHQGADGEWVYDYGIEEDGNTARQLADILGHNVSPAPTTVTTGSISDSKSGFPVVGAVAALAALILVLGTVLFVRERRGGSPLERQFRRFYQDVGRTVDRLERKTGLPGPAGMGWIAWTELACERLNGQAESMRRLTSIAIHNLYAGQQLPADALRLARAARKSIRYVPGRGIRHGLQVRLRQMTRRR